MTLIDPLNLGYWFVNVFSGSWLIFSLISLMVITSLCAYFKMPMGAFTIMLVCYAVILKAAGQEWVIILLIFLLAPLLFWITRRVVD